MMVINGLEVPRPGSAKRADIREKSEDMDNLIEQLQGFEVRKWDKKCSGASATMDLSIHRAHVTGRTSQVT